MNKQNAPLLVKNSLLCSYEKPIKNKHEKLNSNTPEFNKLLKNLNYDPNSTNNNLNYKNILETVVGYLGNYSVNLNKFSSKWGSYKLVTQIKFAKAKKELLDLEREQKAMVIKNNLKNSMFKSLVMPKVEVNKPSASKINQKIVYDYLKSISIFNSTHNNKLLSSKEQVAYNFNYLNYFKPEKLYKIILSSFISMNSLISEPVFQETPNEMVIHIFMYSFKTNNMRLKNKFSPFKKTNSSTLNKFVFNNTLSNASNNLETQSERFIEINKNKLNILCKILSYYFKKPVTLHIVKLYYPYFDSNIFVNLLQKVINKITIRRLMLKFFKKAVIKNPTRLKRKNSLSKIPSVLSGIKIRSAGRLLTHRVVPRQTIKNVRRGALARGKVNILNTSRITNKNKRGAYSITVSIGQNINI